MLYECCELECENYVFLKKEQIGDPFAYLCPACWKKYISENTTKDCECGADKTNSKWHSKWCTIYTNPI